MYSEPMLSAASRSQPAALVAIVVNLDHRDRLADNKGISGQGNVVLEGLPYGPQLLVVAVGVNEDLLDQRVQVGEVLVAVASSTH